MRGAGRSLGDPVRVDEEDAAGSPQGGEHVVERRRVVQAGRADADPVEAGRVLSGRESPQPSGRSLDELGDPVVVGGDERCPLAGRERLEAQCGLERDQGHVDPGPVERLEPPLELVRPGLDPKRALERRQDLAVEIRRPPSPAQQLDERGRP